MSNYQALAQAISANTLEGLQLDGMKVYNQSLATSGETQVVMIKEGLTRAIFAVGQGNLFDELSGEAVDGGKVCPLTHENRLVLNRHLDYTVPRAFGTQVATIGLGDRLGLASPGHIKTVSGRDIRPILAQQSIREITLTGRTYKDVMDAACFAVFQEGYKDGFGADGDHLKVEADIEMALDLGFTMLTLDCSEKIDNTVEGSSEQEIAARYEQLPAEVRSHYEGKYLNQTFEVGEHRFSLSKEDLMKNVLIYGAAIDFIEAIYHKYIVKSPRGVDFEISIDETATPTEPAAHFLVANELYARDLTIYSMAPAFCGEFQKGIDYIGNLTQFEAELAVHAALCDHFGYKLSVHSGSDKFSVFALVAKYTNGRFHIKTAGTNWLEAVRTVAKVNPDLYRRMHAFALANREEALAYYHVTTNFAAIAPLESVSDADLPTYMDEDNARQLIHITYGILLQARNEAGEYVFRDEFFASLIDQEEAYEASLQQHIGKHLNLLGK